MALHQVQKQGDLKIDKLLINLNAENRRVSVHGVSVELVRKQADSLGIPLEIMEIPAGSSMLDYDKMMDDRLQALQDSNYTHGIFGDILLEDLRNYREKQFSKAGIIPVFPLWKKDTRKLAETFIESGHKALIVCVNAAVLDQSFCGREFDKAFLSDLPENVDLCGENGEFHTFVYDGPLFSQEIKVEVNQVVSRSYKPNKKDKDDCFTKEQTWDVDFWFADLLSE